MLIVYSQGRSSPPPRPPKPKPRVTFTPQVPPRDSQATQDPAPRRQPFAGVAVLPPIKQTLPAMPPVYHSLAERAPLPPIDAEPELPPYSAEEMTPSQQQQAIYGSQPYRLPDIQASLSVEMKESLRNISGMGFPAPRVARALKRCDGDNQKVMELLSLQRPPSCVFDLMMVNCHHHLVNKAVF